MRAVLLAVLICAGCGEKAENPERRPEGKTFTADEVYEQRDLLKGKVIQLSGEAPKFGPNVQEGHASIVLPLSRRRGGIVGIHCWFPREAEPELRDAGEVVIRGVVDNTDKFHVNLRRCERVYGK